MKLIVLYRSFNPNTAPTNRLLSFIKGFDELGISTEVVFITPNRHLDKLDKSRFSKNITINYLWKERGYKNRIIKLLRSYLDAKKFSKTLTSNSNVFLIGCTDYLHYFTSRDDINVYHERTEHPSVIKTLLSFEQNKYLQACRKTTGIFVISTALKRYFESIGCKDVYIINMTVDSNRFKGLEKQPSERYIAYCGTASNNKDGVDELIKSFAIVHQKHPNIKLYIIGKTPDKEDSAGNLRLIDELGVKDFVVFTGIVQASEMPQLLKNAEIVALDRPDSLQAQTGFPTKLGEYLLTENPVVVTKVGDIPLFIKDGETGLLAEERNSQAFSDKLIWALEHPVEAAEIGKRGAELALREFDYLNETKKIINIIYG